MKKVIAFILVICMVTSLFNGISIQAQESTVLWQNTGGYFDCYGGKLSRSVVDGSTCGSIENKVHKFTFTNATSFYNGGPAAGGFGNAWATADLTGKIDSSVLTFSMKTPKDGMRFSIWFCDDNNGGRLYKNFEVATKDTWTSFTVLVSDMLIGANDITLQTLQYILINPWEGSEKGTQAVDGDDFYLGEVKVKSTAFELLWKNAGGYFDLYGGKLSRAVVDGSTCGSIENKVQKFTFTNATSFYNGGPAAGGQPNGGILPAVLTGKIDSSVLTFSMKTPKDGMRFSLWFCDDNNGGRLYKNFEVAAKDTWTSFTVPVSDMLIGANGITLQQLQYILINPWEGSEKGTQAVNGDAFYLGEVKVTKTTYNSLWKNAGGNFDLYGGKLSRAVVDGSTCGSTESKVQKFTFTNATSFYNGGPAAAGFANTWASADLTSKIDSSVLTFSMKTPKDGMRFSLWFCDDTNGGRLYKNFEVATKDTWTNFTVPLSDMLKGANGVTLQQLQYILINTWQDGAIGTQAVDGDIFYLGNVTVRENFGVTSANVTKNVVVGTSLTTALGSTTAAVLNGQATQQIAVSWNALEYNASVPGIYTVHGTLLESGTNSLSALGLLNINNVQAVATVEVKKFIINTYTLNGTMLKNIAPFSGGLTETKFLEKISIGTGTTYTFSNQKVTGKVGTGTTFQITDGESNPSYTVLIKGDVTGDGSVSVEDLAAMKSDLLKLSPLAGVYKTAGDVSQEGNISISDLLSIKKHILGITTIAQS